MNWKNKVWFALVEFIEPVFRFRLIRNVKLSFSFFKVMSRRIGQCSQGKGFYNLLWQSQKKWNGNKTTKSIRSVLLAFKKTQTLSLKTPKILNCCGSSLRQDTRNFKAS